MTKGVNPGIDRCEMSEIVPDETFLSLEEVIN